MLRTVFAAVFAALLLIRPETAVNAAREAMYTWTYSVAPAMFPFMALMPMLTGPEAAAAYERLFGKWMRPLFGLPGAAAPAIVIAMTAGSPAGAVAVSRTAGLSRDAQERLVGCVCGPGPAFLISGIGVGMLGSAADGHLLLRAQIAAQLILLIFTRRTGDGTETAAVPPADPENPVRAAVNGVLGVCGYMMLFQTAAAVAADLLRSEAVGNLLLGVMDLPSGARVLARSEMHRPLRLVILAAMTGFGGLCIAAQNIGACRVRARRVIPVRMLCALLTSAAAAVQLYFPEIKRGNPPPAAAVSAFFAGILAVPTWFFLANTFFLNKRKFPENGKNPIRIQKNPQHVVDNVEKSPSYNEFQKT